MTRIFVSTDGQHSDYEILGVYLTLEEALVQKTCGWVEVWEGQRRVACYDAQGRALRNIENVDPSDLELEEELP